MISSGDFSHYSGWRTPGYPFVIYLCSNNYVCLTLLQSVLGIIGVLFASYILHKSTQSFLCTLAYGLFLSMAINIVVIDSNILTESLATFFVSSIVLLTFMVHSTALMPPVPHVLALGLLLGILTLVRPQYIVMIPVLALYMYFRNDSKRINRFSNLACLLTASCIPVIALLSFNYFHLGKPMLSATIGFNITNHTLPFIESGKSADTLDIIPEMVKLRDEHWDYAQSLDDNRAFIPRPKIPGTAVERSTYYLQLSKEAIKKEPLKYLSSVATAWSRFWRVSLFYDVDNARHHALDKFVRLVWPFQKMLWLFLNLVFLISAALVARNIFLRKSIGWYECTIVLVLAVSVLQALVEFGDNSRYAIPLQPTIGLIALYSLSKVDTNRVTIASVLSKWNIQPFSHSSSTSNF